MMLSSAIQGIASINRQIYSTRFIIFMELLFVFLFKFHFSESYGIIEQLFALRL